MRVAIRSLLAAGALSLLLLPVSAQDVPKLDPAAPTLEFVYEEQVTLAPDVPVGDTPQGHRNIVPITGGTFSGPQLKGKILPGGWDWQLATGGCFHILADYFVQTDDGVVINVHNTGTGCAGADGKREPILTTPRFEAPKGKYEWLNGGAYIGTLEGTKIDGKPAVRIRFFRARPAAH